MKNNPNTGYTVEAEYSEQFLKEYMNNPLIEALPPIFSYEQSEELLHLYPEYNPKERELDAHYRYHCVQRLFRYFQPLGKHLDIEQKISRVIRQGYISRNPLMPEYASDMQKIYKMIKQGNYKLDNCVLSPTTSSGFTIIGFSGVGKTKTVERILALYPQIIVHSEYKHQDINQYQLVWLKLDCPHDGSVKGLCVNFFQEIDRLLGDDSYNKFAAGRNTTTDTMIPRMAQIARRHSLGVLVIDEIQHLSVAKSGGQEKMLNFFVTLVNTIGIPVILIGTSKALPILQGEFRQAKRGSGQQGDVIWENMPKNEHWELLIEGMWQYQWTEREFELTRELMDVLYDESQGIIDIAVKLYAMAQIRAIATGKEIITPAIIKQVAEDNLKLIRPMLLALKSGNRREIAKYGDIMPIDIKSFCEEQERLLELNQSIKRNKEITKRKQATRSDLLQESVLKLIGVGIKPELAKKAVEEVMKDENSSDTSSIVKAATLLALKDEIDSTQSKKRRRSGSIQKIREKAGLMAVIENGRKENKSAYDALREVGLIGNPVEEFINIG
jgi:hypothetical protein